MKVASPLLAAAIALGTGTMSAGVAAADCGTDIDAFVEASLPPQTNRADAADANSDADEAAERDATQIMKEEIVEGGPTVQDNGGTTTYSADGPALPTENWFGYPPEKKDVADKLAEAMDHAEKGNEAACLTALDEAKTLNLES